MSSIFSELRRSERLLPVEDSASFQRISSWHPLVIDAQTQPALYEHVAFFRGDTQRDSKWMYTIRSTRVSTRQVPFMNLTPTDAKTAPGRTTTTTTTTGSTIASESLGGDDADDVPDMLVCRRRIEALAPYECLMCPTLLFSPLRPSSARSISRIAAQLSLPAQEVFLFVSMMLVYLDLTLVTMLPEPLSFQELSDTLDDRCMRRFMPAAEEGEDARCRPFAMLLRSAVVLWKKRREVTVTASVSLGCLVTAICLRDIHDTVCRAFVPCAPRNTSLVDHPFRLPPLEEDALIACFLPTWERILWTVRRDTSLLANLHNHLLDSRGNGCMLLASPCMRQYLATTNVFASLDILPQSCEELADFVCRLGASLWASLDMAKSIVLSKVQSQFVTKVIQQVFFATSLRLQHRGMQELRVRRTSLTDLALTVIQDDGREVEVGCPAGFHAGCTAMGGDEQGTASMTKNDGCRSNNLPLWLVAEGGLSVAQTFVRHLLESRRPIASPMAAPPPASHSDDGDVKVDDRANAIKAAAAAAVVVVMEGKEVEDKAEQRFVALTRAEEGVLHRIFQSHGAALHLTGCSIRQLLLRATDGQLILQRVCGVITAWDLWECYDTEDTSRLRRPPRIVTADAPLQLPEGVLPARVTLRGVCGMMQHYWRAILAEQQRAMLSGRQAVTSTTLFPIDKVVILYVLRHHPEYYTKMRGCGIAEICVQQQPKEQRQCCADGGRRLQSFQQEAERAENRCGQVTADTVEYTPTFAITRTCGSSTVFAYEVCFCSLTGGLRRPQILESGSDAATAAAAAVGWPRLRPSPFLAASRSRKRPLATMRD